MKFRWERFNIYLLLLLAIGLACGCASEEKKRKKQLSVLRLHLEVQADAADRTQPIPVYRKNPVAIVINKGAFLSEENVRDAAVVEVIGGFAVRVQLDRHGALVLDQVSAANKGRRIAFFAAFGIKEGKPAYERWLAAPRITQPITDGVLVFTPDATRDECDDLVIGLKNAAKKYQDKAG